MSRRGRPSRVVEVDPYEAEEEDNTNDYYSGDESEIESDEDMDWTNDEIRTRRSLRSWYRSHQNRSGNDGKLDNISEEVRDMLEKKFEERQEDGREGSGSDAAEDVSYCYQISESSDAEDAREGADMGRDFFWNPSDDSSASEKDADELQQIDPDDAVVEQDGFQPDPVWNSTVDPQVGLWGTNHPHAPFPGTTMKWHSIVWDDGTTYEGLSRENIPHAYGSLVMGSAYAGNLVEPNVGRGVRYEGMFRAGAVEGMGQMSWPKGKVYRGEWVQGQKHGCGALYDFAPMLRYVKEQNRKQSGDGKGKGNAVSPAEAWEATRDEILANAQWGTWNRDRFVSHATDDIQSGKVANPVTTNKMNPLDLCDRATIQGVLEELDSVVQRARMFQHKPDGEVAIRFLQDGRGAPAPVMQDPLHYPHGTKWMAPGPVGQTYSLPDDPELKQHLTKVAQNYHKVYKMYNLPWDEEEEADSDLAKAKEYWPEEYFQDGPNSAWWYKNILFPLERKVEEDIKFHTDRDASEYRKKGKTTLQRTWIDRSRDMVGQFFDRKNWNVKSSSDQDKYEMVKDFVEDCDKQGYVSSWKLVKGIKAEADRRDKDIRRVQSDSKAKALKKQELLHRVELLCGEFEAIEPIQRKERGSRLVKDIVDYGFLKDFCQSGELEVSTSKQGQTDGGGGKQPSQNLAFFSRLKGKDWDVTPSRRRTPVDVMVNPIVDPVDLDRLSPADRERWEKVLDYLYNDLPNDDNVMKTLLTKEQKEFVDQYRTATARDDGSNSGSTDGAGVGSGSSAGKVVPPTNLASLSVGLTRFSFYINKSMSYYAKRAVRHDVFKKKGGYK